MVSIVGGAMFRFAAAAAGDYAGALQRAIPALNDVLKAGATTIAAGALDRLRRVGRPV